MLIGDGVLLGGMRPPNASAEMPSSFSGQAETHDGVILNHGLSLKILPS